MTRKLTLLALLVSVAGIVRAEAPPTEPGLLQRMDKTMLQIGGQLRNAESRIKRGMAGMGGALGSGSEYTTLAVDCCRNNVDAIREDILAIQEMMDETRRHYTGVQDRTALNLLDQMDERVRQLAQATMDFVRAPDQDRALNALTGTIRPWNEFRNGIENLRGCCPVGDEAPSTNEGKAAPRAGGAGR